MTRRLVLVTGMPRSGTTPVGDLLALAPGARTLYEPLNAIVGDRRVQRYFETFDDVKLDTLLDDIRAIKLSLRPGIFPEDRGWRRLAKRVSGSRTTMTYRTARILRPRTIIWKDPFASLLAGRIAERAVPVLATVRPPVAVAASFVRLGWRFDVADLAARLGFAGRFADLDLDRPAVNAGALWHLVHERLLEEPAVRLVDVGALVEDPGVEARKLFAHAGLELTPAVERAVLDRYEADAGAPATPTGRAHTKNRSLRDVNTYWRDVLEPDDVRVVESLNAELWERVVTAVA
jgi:hypothetical protein